MADEALKKLRHFPDISQFHIIDLNSSFMRAIRMSTTTNLIIESMSIGTLKSSQFKITGVNPRNQDYRSRAYASVNSFSWLVDAIELAWMLYSGFGHLLMGGAKPLGACHLKFNLWHLNEEGMVAFLYRSKPITEKDEMLKAKDEAKTSVAAKDKGKLIIL
ncbi:hypothetical protein SESBI_36287 [Sesbania bispinosa]|nr:hypothetical protein SESBI_36287 [Sesbania bispinosa]